MPTLASGVAMTTWQHPSRAALPAKQRPDTTPTRGTRPLSAPNSAKASVSRPGHDGHVGVTGPPPAALGEQDDGQSQAFDELEEAVLLAVVHLALGAGQDGIVVRQHGAARPFLVEEVTVDPPDARNEAVCGRVGDEVLGAAARPLGCDDEPAVLLEAAGVAQVLDVLPRRPAPARVPALGGAGPSRIERGVHPGLQLGQLGPHTGGGRRWFHLSARCLGPRPVGRLVHAQQHVAGLHRVPDGHGNGFDPARLGRLDHVLHLHGLEHDEDRPGAHPVAGRDVDPEHGAGERHRELVQAGHRGWGTSKPTGEPQVFRWETSWTGRRGATPQVPVG